MKITIDIPKEFEEHFEKDRFKESLERIYFDVKEDAVLSGRYELETLEMLKDAFKKAEIADNKSENDNFKNVIDGDWVSEKLPPNGVYVIVSVLDDSGDYPFKYTTSGWHYKDLWVVDGEMVLGNVEAWMPFPKPYKGDK